MSALCFYSFNLNGRELKLNRPVEFTPFFDGEFYVIDDNEQLGMHVRADGETLQDMLTVLVEGIFANWDAYVLVDPTTLRNGQRIYRDQLRVRMTEENNPLWHTLGSLECDSHEPGNWATDSINRHEHLRSTIEGLITLWGAGESHPENDPED